ncbi:MAG TPA: DsbA family protein [Devosia sp.]|nr:DsbA family protein [Devosia sp.]
MKINRRNALIMTAAASAISLGGVSSALGGHAAATSSGTNQGAGGVYDVNALMAPDGWVDRAILGAEDASAMMIEYSSPTCPFCAAFKTQTYPLLKEQYVDTGKTRYILRPFVRNVLDAVVFMLADAAGEEGYHEVVATYLASQQVWSRSDRPKDALMEVALQLGFTEESFEAALTNQELFAGMEAVRDQAVNEFGLTGTPSFYINGKMFSGNQPLDVLGTEIESHQG